jgi:hypothetical protein
MNEAEIRSALIARLASSPEADGAAFIRELFLDGFTRRADLVVANGKLAAFEIKSDRDNLDRLAGQLETYCRYFERVTVVCTQRHLEGVRARASDGVGIWVMGDTGTVTLAKPTSSRRISTVLNWLSFLPVDELRLLLKSAGRKKNGTRADLIARANLLAVAAVRSFVLSYFKRRHERIKAIVSRRARLVSTRQQTFAGAEERLREFLLRAPANVAAIPRKKS